MSGISGALLFCGGPRRPHMIHRRCDSDSAVYLPSGSYCSDRSSPVSRPVARHSYPGSPRSLTPSSDDEDDEMDEDEEDHWSVSIMSYDPTSPSIDSNMEREIEELRKKREEEERKKKEEEELRSFFGQADFILFGPSRPPSPPACIFQWWSSRHALVPYEFRVRAETAEYWEPATFCRRHRKWGMMRLDDVKFREDYTRVVEDRHDPSLIPRVIHRYKDCVLVFPSSDKLMCIPREIASTSAKPDFFYERMCVQCDKTLGEGDPSFYQYTLFCSHECCFERTLEEESFPEIKDDKEKDKGKGLFYFL